MLPPRAGLVGRVALGPARLPGDQEGPSAAPLSRERASHPLPPASAGEGSLRVRETNFFSALLSVTEECARECEDAVDLLRFCQSFSFAAETLVKKACLGEAELSGSSHIRRGLFKVYRLLLKNAALLSALPLFLIT